MTDNLTNLRSIDPALWMSRACLGCQKDNDLVGPPALFFRVVGELGFRYIALDAPSLLSKVDAVERKPCAQWSPPAAGITAQVRSALFSELSDIGTTSSLDVE
jgi:hypothetical protein